MISYMKHVLTIVLVLDCGYGTNLSTEQKRCQSVIFSQFGFQGKLIRNKMILPRLAFANKTIHSFSGYGLDYYNTMLTYIDSQSTLTPKTRCSNGYRSLGLEKECLDNIFSVFQVPRTAVQGDALPFIEYAYNHIVESISFQDNTYYAYRYYLHISTTLNIDDKLPTPAAFCLEAHQSPSLVKLKERRAPEEDEDELPRAKKTLKLFI